MVIVMYKILLVEDDKNIREMVVEYFSRKGSGNFSVAVAPNGETGLQMAYENPYDLLLLDVNLPKMDGFSICKEVRRYSDVPIMFITARVSEDDVLNGYALGCDDYIIKPFALPVLFEKVKALIKRSKGLVRSSVLTVGTLTLNPNNGIVVSDGDEVDLTAKEYNILRFLLENKNIVISRSKLIENLWGYDSEVDQRVLDTHIKNLRKKIEDDPKNPFYLCTVHGIGYKFGGNI